jgi:hypothetical protein
VIGVAGLLDEEAEAAVGSERCNSLTRLELRDSLVLSPGLWHQHYSRYNYIMFLGSRAVPFPRINFFLHESEIVCCSAAVLV